MKKIYLSAIVIALSLSSCGTNDDIATENKTVNHQAKNNGHLTDYFDIYQELVSTYDATGQVTRDNYISSFQFHSILSPVFAPILEPNYDPIDLAVFDDILDTDNDILIQKTSYTRITQDYLKKIVTSNISTIISDIQSDNRLNPQEKQLLLNCNRVKSLGGPISRDTDWNKKRIIGYAIGYQNSRTHAFIYSGAVEVMHLNNQI